MTDYTLITLNPAIEQRPFAATIGFFDGVHRGHRHVLDKLKQIAAERQQSTLVVCFERHPRHVVNRRNAPQLLTTNDEKLALLKDYGIDACAMLRFTPAMAALTAREFMQHYLHEQLNVATLLIGYDHTFGRPNPNEGFAQYASYGREWKIDVINADRFPQRQPLSSSAVRAFLGEGDVAEVRALLSRPYSLCGTVVEGQQNGRKLGFPTANIRPDSIDKIIPAKGVYATLVRIDDEEYAGMTNIGVRPTLSNDDTLTIESHILDFNDNIYGKTICISFIDRLRNEVRFPSVESLRQQLQQDAGDCRRLLSALLNR